LGQHRGLLNHRLLRSFVSKSFVTPNDQVERRAALTCAE